RDTSTPALLRVDVPGWPVVRSPQCGRQRGLRRADGPLEPPAATPEGGGVAGTGGADRVRSAGHHRIVRRGTSAGGTGPGIGTAAPVAAVGRAAVRTGPGTAGTAHPGTARHSACRRNNRTRSEEHTSELQSRFDLVCRLLLEKT